MSLSVIQRCDAPDDVGLGQIPPLGLGMDGKGKSLFLMGI
jgi:hypothetical protein